MGDEDRLESVEIDEFPLPAQVVVRGDDDVKDLPIQLREANVLRFSLPHGGFVLWP
jgi:hypothetical protein